MVVDLAFPEFPELVGFEVSCGLFGLFGVAVEDLDLLVVVVGFALIVVVDDLILLVVDVVDTVVEVVDKVVEVVSNPLPAFEAEVVICISPFF